MGVATKDALTGDRSAPTEQEPGFGAQPNGRDADGLRECLLFYAAGLV